MALPHTPWSHTILVGALLAATLSGCKKADAPPAPKTSSSVALPDSSRPVSDANVSPTPATTSDNGNANLPAQNNPSALSKEQESTGMPLSGQVNNHSTANPNNDKSN
jgi:uncharacterized membrane protein